MTLPSLFNISIANIFILSKFLSIQMERIINVFPFHMNIYYRCRYSTYTKNNWDLLYSSVIDFTCYFSDKMNDRVQNHQARHIARNSKNVLL